MVVDHNDIDESHTCTYAFTNENTGEIQEFGVFSGIPSDDVKDGGGQVLRKALQQLAYSTESDFTIYNHSEYQPQLEISRLPHDVRDYMYENKEYTIQESAKGTPAYSGEFLVTAAINFISNNYSSFTSPVSTEIPPKSQTTKVLSDETETKYTCNFNQEGTYYLYTDASYHPKTVETGISFVIIGENGGMYAKGMKVDAQVIDRAELLAFLKGIMVIQSQTNQQFEIVANTDSENVKKALSEGLIIDRGLNSKIEEVTSKENCTIDARCIDRKANMLPDALAKICREEGTIEIGQLTNPVE